MNRLFFFILFSVVAISGEYGTLRTEKAPQGDTGLFINPVASYTGLIN